MSKNYSKLNATSFKTIAKTRASSDSIYRRQRITQSVLVIWVNASIDQSNKDCQNTLVQLQNVVDDVHIFTQRDECIDFLTEVDDVKISLIMTGTLGQQILPFVHDIPQLDGVYIYDSNKYSPEQWTKTWVKVKGVHTEITPICESIQQSLKQFNQDSIAVSFITMQEGASSPNLDELEPTFMYTQIFKEILFEMEHNEQSIKDLAIYCRGLYNKNSRELNVINEFERHYRPELSIWWYTRECFTYQMLNRALRALEADTIINMGFFIRDLHQKIEELYQKQVGNYREKFFIVYRGQGLSITDLKKLRKTIGGLMSFNNFLSTSKTREVSLRFAKGALGKIETVGILFQMSIDPSVSSTRFASIKEVSYFKKEEEILFSMHTVFRIGDIKQIDKNNGLYQVELTLTSDDDPQLRILTEHIREETRGGTRWETIGTLLLKISQFDKVDELYSVLLGQTHDEGKKAYYYNQLGYVKHDQGDYEKALWYYEKGLEIWQETLPSDHPGLANSYNNIGGVYRSMGEYLKVLWFYEKSLEIWQKTLPPNHSSLATSNNNIGEVYDNIGEYSKALSFYEKALEIWQKTLPPNHPSLATSHNNIAFVYENMENYSKALSYFEYALDIKQNALPPNHPSIQKVRKSVEIVKKKL